MKKAIETVGLILLFCFFGLLIGVGAAVIVGDKVDKAAAVECAECDAEYSWCPGYWEYHNLCGYGDKSERVVEVKGVKVGD